MTMTIYDVCGIGSAIVDVITMADDAFIKSEGLVKGTMALIDEDRAHYLYEQMEDVVEASGGSVANTLAGIASLGGMPTFIGKTKQDVLGEVFRADMHGVGVHFDTIALTSGKATARCYIFVTPDAQRTMNTYLGACTELTEADINDALIGHSKITYVEGYLWDLPHAKAAIRKAFDVAKKYKRQVAFSLSDIFCVDRHRAEFIELIHSHIDILFANENELYSLVKTLDFDAACDAIRGKCPIVVVTRSGHGSVVITAQETITIPGKPIKLVDSTGAGDLYAAGFLFGITQGWPLKKSAELGAKCAEYIIQQMGARPAKSLNSLI
jgi:sugar/nucleoside kinase (ribokinase family)